MWLELASASFLVADWIYRHNNTDANEGKQREPSKLTLPRVDRGAPVPLIYGRCRVDAPVLADLRLVNVVDETVLVDMLFIVGIGMDDGQGTTRILDMWSGDKRAASSHNVDSAGKWAQTGVGGFEEPVTVSIVEAGEGRVETLNGNLSQALVDDAGVWLTYAGQHMRTDYNSGIIDPDTGQYTWSVPAYTIAEIPGYRRYACVFLFEIGDGSGWRIGSATARSLPPYSFEVSSIQDSNGYPAVGVYASVGPDCNPANVLWDLLKARFGKLGIDASLYLDSDSFSNAATTLYQESHGYSLAIQQSAPLGQCIVAVLEQIGGVLYEDPSDGKLHLDLVRNDYDPANLPIISKENCEKLDGFAVGTWRGVPNAVRLVYRNRDDDYREASEEARNQANAVGQDSEQRWQVVEMPGVTNSDLAKRLVARLLAERSRPLIKFRAHLDRSFIRLRPGQPVMVRWTNPDISNLVFRVVTVDFGTLTDGTLAVDFIQDVNYVWRGKPPKVPHFGVPGIRDLGLR